jgi:hypothetical protein
MPVVYHPTAEELVQHQLNDLANRIATLEDTAVTKPPFLVDKSRDLNAVFPMPDRPTLVVYTFSLNVVAVLLTLTSIQVDLLADEQATPTTVRGSCSLGVTANGLSLALNQTTIQTITCLIQPGHNVLLQTTGAGTAALVAQVEALL